MRKPRRNWTEPPLKMVVKNQKPTPTAQNPELTTHVSTINIHNSLCICATTLAQNKAPHVVIHVNLCHKPKRNWLSGTWDQTPKSKLEKRQWSSQTRDSNSRSKRTWEPVEICARLRMWEQLPSMTARTLWKRPQECGDAQWSSPTRGQEHTWEDLRALAAQQRVPTQAQNQNPHSWRTWVRLHVLKWQFDSLQIESKSVHGKQTSTVG